MTAPATEIRFSCADFTFPLLEHDAALKLIRMLGISAVDVGVFSQRSHIQPEHIQHRASAAGKALAKKLASMGLALADVFVQLGMDPAVRPVNDVDLQVRRANRDAFSAMVEFAHAAGASHMTGLPGVFIEGQNNDAGLAVAAEESTWRVAEARAAGLTYAIEPHVGSNCPTPDAALQMLNRVPGLTLTYDPGHFVYQGQPAAAAHRLIPHASHFHARAGAVGRLQVRLPHNAIDFSAMIERAGSNETRRPFICLEYVWVEWEGCNEVDNVSETILLKRHLEQLCRTSGS